jgi:hypothetical protein
MGTVEAGTGAEMGARGVSNPFWKHFGVERSENYVLPPATGCLAACGCGVDSAVIAFGIRWKQLRLALVKMGARGPSTVLKHSAFVVLQ